MPVDYGFRSRAGRLYEDKYGAVPESFWELVSLLLFLDRNCAQTPGLVVISSF
jgi:hypothetical protein